MIVVTTGVIPMSLSMSLREWARKSLDERTCPAVGCGERKVVGRPFCMNCYVKLPPKMKRAMYGVLSDQFAVDYADARDWLRDNG